MSDNTDDLQVVNNAAVGRFEVEVDGRYAFSDYGITAEGMVLTHTEVPPELEGRGLASRIVRTALDHARTHGLAVIPYCPYASSWIRRHAEYRDLVPQPYHWLLERQQRR
jgi:uncharacterized protein